MYTAKELLWLCKNKELTAPDGEPVWVCPDCGEVECTLEDDELDFSTATSAFNGEEI